MFVRTWKTVSDHGVLLPGEIFESQVGRSCRQHLTAGLVVSASRKTLTLTLILALTLTVTFILIST